MTTEHVINKLKELKYSTFTRVFPSRVLILPSLFQQSPSACRTTFIAPLYTGAAINTSLNVNKQTNEAIISNGDVPCRNHAYRDQGRLIYIQEEIDGLTAAAIAVAVASTLPDTDANRTARKLSDLLRWDVTLCEVDGYKLGSQTRDGQTLQRFDWVGIFIQMSFQR